MIHLIAGRGTNVTVSITTVGYIPMDAKIEITFPPGVALSLPSRTNVTYSTCCIPNTNSSNPPTCATCNATVSSIRGSVIVVQLGGNGASNFPTGTNVTFMLDSIRNLYAGPKDGFDISLFLSDGVSSVLQAKDVDGPVILPDGLAWADIQFSETPTLSLTYSTPIAGRCGAYRFNISLIGLLPANAKIEVTFPRTISLNEPTCDFDTRFPQPISRLTYNRHPPTLIDSTIDSFTRKVVIFTATLGSETWPKPGYVYVCVYVCMYVCMYVKVDIDPFTREVVVFTATLSSETWPKPGYVTLLHMSVCMYVCMYVCM
jgi:hypothetical protein